MLYIHGINHNAQHLGPACDHRDAKALLLLLDQLYPKLNYKVLAEEFSIDACSHWQVEETICHMFAKEHGLCHIYCEPTLSERATLGIPTQHELEERVQSELGASVCESSEANTRYKILEAELFPMRELFWMQKLAPHKISDILFICGSAHIESFRDLLVKDGWQVHIII